MIVYSVGSVAAFVIILGIIWHIYRFMKKQIKRKLRERRLRILEESNLVRTFAGHPLYQDGKPRKSISLQPEIFPNLYFSS